MISRVTYIAQVSQNIPLHGYSIHEYLIPLYNSRKTGSLERLSKKMFIRCVGKEPSRLIHSFDQHFSPCFPNDRKSGYRMEEGHYSRQIQGRKIKGVEGKAMNALWKKIE